MNNSYITIIKEKRTALSRKRIPLNQNGCTANFRIGVPFEQNLQVNTSILLEITFNIKDSSFSLQISDFLLHVLEHVYSFWYDSLYHINKWRIT